jgi:Tol biopolymer transport system component
MKRLTILLILFVITANVYAQDASKNLGISDILALKQIQEIQQSPDEQWIAYVLSSKDTVKDKANNQIWMVSTEGGEPIPMTAKGYSASSPRWSPDGKYLSFLAKKKGKGKSTGWRIAAAY